MTETEERIGEINRRVEELDKLLAKDIAPTSANAPRTQSAEELQYFADRREERQFLLAELEEILRNKE